MTKVILYSIAGGLATVLALSLIKRKPTMKRVPVSAPITPVVESPMPRPITAAQIPITKNLATMMNKIPNAVSAPKPAPMPAMNADLIRKLNLAIKK